MPGLQDAAVLVPLFRDDQGELRLVLVRRGEGGIHGGQLALPETHGEALEKLAGWTEPRLIPFYRVGPHRLWGATYRILHPLIPRLTAGEWNL